MRSKYLVHAHTTALHTSLKSKYLFIKQIKKLPKTVMLMAKFYFKKLIVNDKIIIASKIVTNFQIII